MGPSGTRTPCKTTDCRSLGKDQRPRPLCACRPPPHINGRHPCFFLSPGHIWASPDMCAALGRQGTPSTGGLGCQNSGFPGARDLPETAKLGTFFSKNGMHGPDSGTSGEERVHNRQCPHGTFQVQMDSDSSRPGAPGGRGSLFLVSLLCEENRHSCPRANSDPKPVSTQYLRM